MHNVPTTLNDPELDAYNAAFHELGLRWHWDAATYRELQARHADDATRVRHYLETHQSHLLRAYDCEFLVDMIEQKKLAARHAATDLGRHLRARATPFPAAQARG